MWKFGQLLRQFGIQCCNVAETKSTIPEMPLKAIWTLSLPKIREVVFKVFVSEILTQDTARYYCIKEGTWLFPKHNKG